MDLIVTADGWIAWPGGRARCALGRGGIVPEADKREGDGATPAGAFAIRRVLYRADRVNSPITVVPAIPLARDDAWCEDPAAADYNRQVKLPRGGAVDAMWREDHLYDICVVLGHNDDPVRRGLGSAVFLHLARNDYSATAGCIAVSRADMERVLRAVTAESRVIVRAS
jgi:L,D-peptidoglycan transpeptidase YkuD (ErfK/YbiS/YcfS/YnhG family)